MFGLPSTVYPFFFFLRVCVCVILCAEGRPGKFDRTYTGRDAGRSSSFLWKQRVFFVGFFLCVISWGRPVKARRRAGKFFAARMAVYFFLFLEGEIVRFRWKFLGTRLVSSVCVVAVCSSSFCFNIVVHPRQWRPQGDGGDKGGANPSPNSTLRTGMIGKSAAFYPVWRPVWCSFDQSWEKTGRNNAGCCVFFDH